MRVTLKHPDGETLTHIAGGPADYATVCGIATDGDADSAKQVKRTGARVTCEVCAAIWKECNSVARAEIAPDML